MDHALGKFFLSGHRLDDIDSLILDQLRFAYTTYQIFLDEMDDQKQRIIRG